MDYVPCFMEVLLDFYCLTLSSIEQLGHSAKYHILSCSEESHTCFARYEGE